MARAITGDEQAQMRSDGFWSELYLAIGKPTVYMTARVNQAAWTSYDSITEIPYDGDSGLAVAGMTMYVGSSAGAYDKGMVRLRLNPDTTNKIFYIAETSEIQWADNDYLTVVDEFGIWPRHLRQVGDITTMDWDVEYSDQHENPLPMPVLGHDPVLWLPEGGHVTWQPDATQSWAPEETIAGYLWSAPTASYTSGMNTATPVIQYNTTGQHWVSCTITTSNGKQFTGHRHTFVYDASHPPVTQFLLGRSGGNYESGNWSFEVILLAEADRSNVRDRAWVILFARDYYANTERLIGPYSDGTGNIVCSGWIDGESIEWDPELSTVTFTVQGPTFWLGKIGSFPIGLKHVNADPTTWVEMKDLTVDKALWHLLMWRSTAPACMDILPSGDTRLASALEAPAGSLWEQITTIAEQSILAHPCCDRYGRLHVQVDTQYLAAAARSSIPTVMAITNQDWQGRINLERSVPSKTGIVDVAGVSFDGTTANPILARAPGHVYKQFGGITSVDRLLFSDQEGANTIAGAILAAENNEYPNVDIDLAMNNRMLDICPRQYVTLTLAAGDTPRGVSFTAKKFIPREVSFSHDPDTGALQTSLSLEAETLPDLAIMIVPPQPPEENTTTQPTTPTWTSGSSAYPPTSVTSPSMPPTTNECASNTGYAGNGPFKVWGLAGLLDGNTWLSRTAVYKGILRSSSHSNKSGWAVRAVFQSYDEVTATWKSITPSDLWLEVQALKNGSVVATGTHDPILSQYYQTGKFDNSASKEFDAIRLSLKGASFAGLSSSTFYWDNAPSWGPLATNEVFDAPVITHVGDESATALFHSTGDVSLASPDLKLHFARNLPSPNNQWPENSRWRIQMTADFNAVDAQAANSHLSHTPPCLDIAKDNTSFYGGNFTHFVPTLVGTRASLDTVYTKPLPSNTIWMTLSVTVTPNTLVHYPREVDIQLIVSPAPDANRRIVIQEFLIWNICSI